MDVSDMAEFLPVYQVARAERLLANRQLPYLMRQSATPARRDQSKNAG
jgi:hypothetical protein